MHVQFSVHVSLLCYGRLSLQISTLTICPPSYMMSVLLTVSILNANFRIISGISSCHFGLSFKHPHLHAAAAQSNPLPLLFAASNSNWNSVLVSAVCLSEDYVPLYTLSHRPDCLQRRGRVHAIVHRHNKLGLSGMPHL